MAVFLLLLLGLGVPVFLHALGEAICFLIFICLFDLFYLCFPFLDGRKLRLLLRALLFLLRKLLYLESEAERASLAKFRLY
jgi:hypothetical protein